MIYRLLCFMLFFSSIASATGGNTGGNAGDFITALKKANLYEKVMPPNYFSEEAVSEIRASFFRQGAQALWSLFILSEAGFKFHDERGLEVAFTPDDALLALKLLKKITTEPGKFRLDRQLLLNDEEVTAVNFSNGTIAVNPVRWRMMKEQYAPEFSERLQGVIAAHEILSLMSQKFESTGRYYISLSVVEFEKNFLSTLSRDNIDFTPSYPHFRNGKLPDNVDEWMADSDRNAGGLVSISETTFMSSDWNALSIAPSLYSRDIDRDELLKHGRFLLVQIAQLYPKIKNDLHIRSGNDVSLGRDCRYDFKQTGDPLTRLRQYRFEMLVREAYALRVKPIRGSELDFADVNGSCQANFRSLFDAI